MRTLVAEIHLEVSVTNEEEGDASVIANIDIHDRNENGSVSDMDVINCHRAAYQFIVSQLKELLNCPITPCNHNIH